jgi:hypothetical protein
MKGQDSPSTRGRLGEPPLPVLPEAAHVRLSVFNVLGQEVARLVDGAHHAGRHELRWDAQNVPSGVYAYTIEAGRFRETRRMVVLR